MHFWNMLTDRFGDLHTPYTGAVTLLDLLLYWVLSINVSRARGKYKVDAPATDGPPGFQRVYRVHMNTLEQMALHLPLLWLAAYAIGDGYAALAGVIWLLGRILYARDYYAEPKKRARGFIIGLLSDLILAIGAAAGVIVSL